MPTPLDLTGKSSKILVEFSYGNPVKFARYAAWTDDVAFSGDIYSATPSMAVRLPRYDGLPNEKQPAAIKLPIGPDDPLDPFMGLLTLGDGHAPVDCTIYEILEDPTGVEADDELTLFRGRVRDVTRNFRGNAQSAQVRVGSIRGRFGVPMGLPAMPQCVWNFRTRGCVISDGAGGHISTITPTNPPTKGALQGTIVTITNRVITTNPAEPVISLIPPGAAFDRYYHRGYVEHDGLRIGIRDYDRSAIGAATFILMRRPPATWLGQIVQFEPGCDKTIGTCRNRWANESQFGGFGIAISKHNPLFENPG